MVTMTTILLHHIEPCLDGFMLKLEGDRRSWGFLLWYDNDMEIELE